MPFAAALSTVPQALAALEEVCTNALAALHGPADLALLFLSPHHNAHAGPLAAAARERLGPACRLGCSGEAVVGNDQEVELGPALSLWLGRWQPPVRLTPFHLTFEQTADGHTLAGWPDELAGADPNQAAVLLLGDPFTFPTDLFLRRVNQEHKGLRVLGGMASGGSGPGQAPLLLGDRALDEGAVGVLLEGPVR